jgi:hypothetical protein
MNLKIKYLNGESDIITAAEHQMNGDWISFVDEDNQIAATIRADKVLSITRAKDSGPFIA